MWFINQSPEIGDYLDQFELLAINTLASNIQNHCNVINQHTSAIAILAEPLQISRIFVASLL